MKRLAAKYVYTLESIDPLIDGYVEYEDDGTIVAVGKCDGLSGEENVWDGAVVPGFVNAHCHVELSHLQGKFTKGSGMAGFIDQINSLRDSVSRREKISLLEEQMRNMWAAGVSAMADISNCDDSFACKAASPMYTRTFLEVFGTEPQDCAAVIAGAKTLLEEAGALGMDASITPHSCYTMSAELLTAASAEGLAKGWLSYHSQESRQEEEMILYGTGELYENRHNAGMSTPPATGKSSLEYFLDRLIQVHLAPFEERILLVHNVCLTSEVADVALSMLKNVYWAICPLSNIFIHNTLPPVKMMRDKGLDICIGTDSLSSNDELDMLSEIKCVARNFSDIPLGEILTWACLNGARFLGKESVLGTLTPGKRPGIVGITNIFSSSSPANCSIANLTPSSRSVRLA